MPDFPDDWYWQVAGDTTVWSSARFAYVDPTVDTAFQTWASNGNQAVAISDRYSLSQLMTGQRLSDYLMMGIVITCTGAPGLSSTYALDPLTLDQVGTVARDSACGLNLPGGYVSFAYPDINGVMRSFNASQIQHLYMAMRDFVLAITTAIAQLALQVPGIVLPPNTATIP